MSHFAHLSMALLQLSWLGAAAPPTEAQARGRKLYRDGASASGRPVRAALGDGSADLAGESLPCAGCHGRDGRGRPEGGVEPSDIRWAALTKPYRVRTGSGRERGPYTRESLGRALAGGVDPSGVPLAAAMPRYAISETDLDDLFTYLQVLGSDPDPGVEENRLRIGVAFPPAPSGDAVRRVLENYFAEVNRKGGVYGRRIDLREGDRDVFAFVAPYGRGADSEETPVLGPLTMSGSAGKNVFHLFPSVADQMETALGFLLSRRGGAPLRIEIAGGQDQATAPAARRLREVCRAPACLVVSGGDADAVIALSPDAAPPARTVVSPGGIFQPLSFRPGEARGEILMTLPALPSDRTPRAQSELSRLAGSDRPGWLAFAAYAAARLFVDALEGCGRDLTRERLVRTLEAMSGHDTGLTRPLSFSPNRRSGLRGAYILRALAPGTSFTSQGWAELPSR